MFRSFKNYSVEGYKKALEEITFPHYESYSDINEAYLNFINSLNNVINEIAPLRSLRVNDNSPKKNAYR